MTVLESAASNQRASPSSLFSSVAGMPLRNSTHIEMGAEVPSLPTKFALVEARGAVVCKGYRREECGLAPL